MQRLKTIFPVILFLLVMFMTNSCKKDKLTGDLDAFEGRYTWTHSIYKEEWWQSFNTTVNASGKDYTAEIEFTNTGKIIFYINGEEIHKTGYSIESQDAIGDWIHLEVDPFKEDTKELDLNDKVQFSISGDTLNVSTFPGNGYDASFGGGNYFLRN
jgi:hypothetical protein